MSNNMQTIRKNKGLTQTELANIVDVTPDYISMIERGIQTPGFKLACKIAHSLNVAIEELNFFADVTNKTFDSNAQ